MAAVEAAAIYPGIFGTVGALNGVYFDLAGAVAYAEQNPFADFDAIFGPSQNQRVMAAHAVYSLIESASDVPGTRFVVGCCALDSWDVNESNEVLRQHLFQLRIPHDSVEFFGTKESASSLSIIPVFVSLQLGAGDTYGEINGNPYHVFKSR